MTQPWEPLLDGADHDLALEIVATIASQTEIPVQRPGLKGALGVAMFLAHAESAGLGDDLGAMNALDRGLAELEDGCAFLGLWNGAAGVRWVVSELTTPHESAAILAQLDRAIQTRLAAPHGDGYDLCSGLAGVLLAYADDETHGNRVLASVLDRLETVELLPPERHQLGCYHGVAGVLGALACCHLRGRSDERTAPLMLAIASALEDCDVSDQRVGWCRGDPGIAIALLAAARASDATTCWTEPLRWLSRRTRAALPDGPWNPPFAMAPQASVTCTTGCTRRPATAGSPSTRGPGCVLR